MPAHSEFLVFRVVNFSRLLMGQNFEINGHNPDMVRNERRMGTAARACDANSSLVADDSTENKPDDH